MVQVIQEVRSILVEASLAPATPRGKVRLGHAGQEGVMQGNSLARQANSYSMRVGLHGPKPAWRGMPSTVWLQG